MKKRRPKYLLCVADRGFEASLVVRRVYEKLPDLESERHGLVRVLDEDGEDYAFPAGHFVPVALSKEAARALRRVA